MGLIATITRHMRNNRLSHRLSSQSTKIPDDDKNDLIKPFSETTSLRAESVASTSTMVHHSLHEPVLPSDPPANRMAIRTDHLNTSTLFETSSQTTPISPTDNRAMRALSRPEYPVFKLDMCQAPFEPRKLAGPLETGPKKKILHTRRIGEGRGIARSLTDGDKGVNVVSSRKRDGGGVDVDVSVKEKRRRRSMKDLLMKHCGLNIPRSSLSLKTRKSSASASPKWLDSAGVGEDGDKGFVEVKDEKWLEAHLGSRGRRNAVWGGSALGRPL
ncbi:uncharacterized protein N7511_000528 [Penicillium nucicola]|uniref:uncharacterized protein n=1 Tax=Penicillium nucicola TaxID=1850975 RepID=UPI0025452E7C|nr:uncharacterized protein N7511_000528 [Penicillium nucicola]KAJ5775517.1 hypothetical protein N7511_000528 [Penicillium nucicola]